jgi:chromosome segregation ATPase
MNEETKQEQAAQEVAAAAQAQSQGQEPQVKGEGGQNQPQADPIRELEELRRKAEALERELKRTREEAASRRVEKKSLEERIQEMEAALNAMRERAALEAARAELVAAFGDKGVAEAALKLAKVDGLLRVEGEEVQVDLESLFQRYPILRVRRAPQDTGANPPATPQLTRESIANMTPEEYAKRRKEILDALAKGLIR